MGEIEISEGGIGAARGAEFSKDRGKARDGCENCKYQNKAAAFVLNGGAAMHEGEIEIAKP